MNKSIWEVSLGDIMGEDHDVYLKRDDKWNEFVIEIDDENGEAVARESIHPFAAEGMASFCRRYLNMYEKATREEA